MNIHTNFETYPTDMLNGIIGMLNQSFNINGRHNSQMMKSLDAIIRIQNRYNISIMPTYLVLKLLLLVSLFIKDESCNELLNLLKIYDKSEARKLIKIIIQRSEIEDGDIKLFYKSGEKLFEDFLHLMKLFKDTDSVKAIDLPLKERSDVHEMSNVSGIDFNNISMNELRDLNCMITAIFKQRVKFKKPFQYVSDKRGEDAKVYWLGKKEEVLSYVLRDTYHWLELKTDCEYYSFVFIVDTSGSSTPFTMSSIKKNCEKKLVERDWCSFMIESDKLYGWEKSFVLYLSDLDLEMDKFIDSKKVKPWRNSINYKVDIEFDDICEDVVDSGEICLNESTVKMIDACDRNVRFMLLDKVHNVPILFGKLT